jgi:predicted O-linked N-acetylglucosamine transferase (SPINDLY family)
MKDARSNCSLYVYKLGTASDEVTEEFKKLSDKWTEVDEMSNTELAREIFADGIDILIDLQGHTNGGLRLHVFASKPAPLQISFLGYPFSTGLSCFDYRIVDKITDTQLQSVEVRQFIDPCFLCYMPRNKDLHPIRPHAGQFTFGSFARIEKINDLMVDTWTKIINACPDSRLILKSKNFVDETVRYLYIGKFAKAGLDVSRIDFVPFAETLRGHLDKYNEIDCLLDPYPYNGTTIICEALVMGVPVVTMCGETHPSRVGASLLNAAGIDNAPISEDEYIRKAIDIYQMGIRPVETREIAREAVRFSALCNYEEYGKKFYQAMRELWQDKCKQVKQEEAVAA